MKRRAGWAQDAEEDLRRLPWADAAWIAAEVVRYVEHGIGDVRRTPLPSGQVVPVLFLPGYRVAFAYDRATRTLWVRAVWRMRRAEEALVERVPRG